MIILKIPEPVKFYTMQKNVIKKHFLIRITLINLN